MFNADPSMSDISNDIIVCSFFIIRPNNIYRTSPDLLPDSSPCTSTKDPIP